MNNKEWLYSLEPHELTEWFDAEHTSNDTLGAKKVVSAESVDANDANAASLKVLSDDTQNVTDDRETAETSNNYEADVTDSREKLEAEIRGKVAYGTSTLLYPPSANKVTQYLPSLSLGTVLGWLDRQAAITDAEWNREVDEHREAVERRANELQEQVDRLTAERDNLAADLLTCNREREQLRKHLGIALDHAHDICALVDIDGNVLDVGD